MRSKIVSNFLVKMVENTPPSRSMFFSTSAPNTGSSVSAHIGTVVPPSPVFMRSTWTEVGRIRSDTRVTWNYRDSVVAQKQFRFRDFGFVTKQRAFAFELGKRFSVFKQSRFKTLANARCFSTSRFNTLFKVAVRDWSLQSASPGAITTGIVHPIDFISPAARQTYFGLTRSVVYPVDYQFNTTIGQVPAPGIQWRTGINPSGRVTCTKSMRFNANNTVVSRKSSAFNINKRYAKTQVMLFNVYNEVTKDMITSWIIGPRTPSHIRLMAQKRTDFAY